MWWKKSIWPACLFIIVGKGPNSAVPFPWGWARPTPSFSCVGSWFITQAGFIILTGRYQHPPIGLLRGFKKTMEIKWASEVVLLVKNPRANAGDVRNAGSIPGLGRSTGVGNGSPPQYSCLENSMDRGACQATVHRITKSWAWLKWFSTYTYGDKIPRISSVQSLSCIWLFVTTDQSTPVLPVHHQLPESTQTHVHWVSDAIQPSHPLSYPSPPALNLSQHQGLFQWVNFAWGGQSTRTSASASVLPMNWSTQDWSPLAWTSWISLQSKGLSRVLSNSTVQKHQFIGAQLSL